MLEIKVKFEALKRLESAMDKLVPKLVMEVNKQTLYFVSDIQRNQMSGRRGNIYLNVDTGNLRRSWFSETKMENMEIATRAYTNVKYAAIHQQGGRVRRKARKSILSFRRSRGRFVNPSQAHYQQESTIGEHDSIIPKRLFVTEEFERQMPMRYEKAFVKAVVEAFRDGR